MSTAADHEYMARALRLAAKALYTTDPNPRVGCVLVKDGRIVGEGWTAPVGGLHAERLALAAARDAARGASAYVTLEPCAHQGRTGPCSEALIAAGVARVVYAGADPNPLVAGAGARALEAAGIEVESGVLEQPAAALNPGYLARMRRGCPWVRSKVAVSLDGRTALADGSSQWLTGPNARRDVHRWRARSSAVLTGVATVLRDDPALTARLENPALDVLQPLRVIVDSQLRTPPEAKVLSGPGAALVFAAAAASDARAGALERAGARVERVPGAPRCDLERVLRRLAELEVNEVWVEAGAVLNGALIRARLIDELIIYMAPQLLGDTARGMFGFGPLASLAERVGLEYQEARMVGGDLRIIARPSTVAGP